MNSGGMATDIRDRSIDRARLTATLATLVPLDVATKISANAYSRGDWHAVLRAAMRLAHRQQLIARARTLLRFPNKPDHEPLLSERAGGSAAGRIAVAFQLGFDLSGQDLASLTERSPDVVGLLMASVLPGQPRAVIHPCTEQMPLLGRYRDASLALEERVRLAQHVAGCAECGGILQELQERDSTVLALINEVYDRSPVVTTSITEGLRGPWRQRRLLGALTLVGIMLLIAGLTLYRSLTDDEPSLAAIAVSTGEAPSNGWLLRDSEAGGIEALNLDTGLSQPVFSGLTQAQQRAHLLSPSGRLMAVWTVSEGNTNSATLKLVDLNGQTVETLEWTFQGFRQSPTAWLSESVLLFSETPVYRSDDNDSWSHAERTAQDSQLFALEVATGRRWTVFRGLAKDVVPSPDGNYVALILPTERDRAGATIEVRPVRADGFGEPVAALQHRYVGASHGPVWAGDSSRVYFAVIGEYPVASGVTPTENLLFHPANNPVNLAALMPNGRFTVLSNVEAGIETSPLAASPDGNSVVYIERDHRAGPDDWTIWRAQADGTGRLPLVQPDEPYPWWVTSVVWARDQPALLVTELESSYLPLASTRATGKTMPVTTFVRYEPDFSPRVMHIYPGVWAAQVHRWLPGEAIHLAERGENLPGQSAFSVASPVESVEPGHRTGESSALSPNGTQILLDWQSGSGSVPSIWQPGTSTGFAAQVAGSTGFEWLPDGTGIIGIASADNDPNGPSRIVIITGAPTNTQDDLQEWILDPLQIGPDVNRRYAEPFVSPDGAKTGFFLIDEQNARVELWLARWRNELIRLHTWTLPGRTRLDPPLAAFWVSNQTIVFVEPADWRDGQPRRSDLKQISLSDKDSAQVENLARFRTYGNESGLAIVELESSSDGLTIAVRLRHFGPSGSDDIVDSVHLISALDMSQGLEVFRGTPGYGVNWSPGGTWLVAGLDDRLGLVSMDGRQIDYFTGKPGDEMRFPIWVSEHEIWFDQVDGDSHTIISITWQ